MVAVGLVGKGAARSECQKALPVGLDGGVVVAAGYNHTVAVRSDGTVEAWGNNNYGQTSVPEGLDDVVAVAAWFYHSVALKSDGTAEAWGYCQTTASYTPFTLPPDISV